MHNVKLYNCLPSCAICYFILSCCRDSRARQTEYFLNACTLCRMIFIHTSRLLEADGNQTRLCARARPPETKKTLSLQPNRAACPVCIPSLPLDSFTRLA
jgi:hypothetical protein